MPTPTVKMTRFRVLQAHEGTRGPGDRRSYRVTVRVHVDRTDATPADVYTLAPVKLGDVYAGWTLNGLGAYVPNSPARDALASLVHVGPRRHPLDPLCWDIELAYEGEGSLLAQAAAVDYGDTSYQETSTYDAAGLAVVNSAGDPFLDGMTRDAHRGPLTVVRMIPWAAWDPDKFEPFRESLNLKPFVHSTVFRAAVPASPPPPPPSPAGDWYCVEGPFGGATSCVRVEVDAPPPDGAVSGPHPDEGACTRSCNPPPPPPPVFVPVTWPPGHAKLTTFTARRVVTRDNPDPRKREYAAEVTFRVDPDYRTFVDNHGKVRFRKWRDVVIDAGYNQLVKGKSCRIPAGSGYSAGGPVLLNGRGRALEFTAAEPDLPDIPESVDGEPVPEHDFHVIPAGGSLTVPGPGVLENDTSDLTPMTAEVAEGEPVVGGAVALDPDGGFTFTPDAGFSGYAHFAYRPRNAAGLGPVAWCVVLVMPRPKVRVHDKYPTLDWEPLAALLANY